MTPRRWRLRDLASVLRGLDRRRLAGVLDFSYQHFALGDVLTSHVIQSCQAIDRGCGAIDCYIFLDPERPAAPVQRFVTPENYWTHLDGLFPALLCAPMLGSVHLLRDRLSVGFTLAALTASRVPTWPSLRDQLRRRMRYPLGHEAINRFHARHGYVPPLSAPRGYAGWARRFVARHLGDRFLVAVHLRQSRLTPLPVTTYRDAPLGEWNEFFRAVGRGYPNVRFLVLGGFAEWEHGLPHYDNVIVPRAMGLTLAHELALLHASQLFMGNSSGFATMATFSGRPYVITGLERYFAAHAGVEPDAERYPFAGPGQYLVWRREDAALLLDYFERLYRTCRGRDPHEARARLACPIFETPSRESGAARFEQPGHGGAQAARGRRRYRWPEGPADRFAMRLCRRLGRGRSWLHRLGFVVLAAGLKHREQVLADGTDVAATLGGPAAMNVLTSLAVWQCELLQDPRTPRLPRKVHARLSFRGDVGEMPLDRLISLVCASDVFDDFCIFWEGIGAPVSEPALRALDHPVSVGAAELARLGPEALQRVFAPRFDPRRAVHGYLKVAHPGALIVAISLPEDPDGFCDAALAVWAPHLQRFQQEAQGTRLCLLNRTVHGAGAVARPLPGIACVRGLGLGLADALALAQLADVYVGGLDVFGIAAMAAQRPGVYIDGAAKEESSTDLQWRCTDDSPEGSLATLRLLVGKLQHPAGADPERGRA